MNIIGIITGTAVVMIGIFGYIHKATNGKVNRSECHKSMDSLKEHIDTRFEDFKNWFKNNGLAK